MRGMARQAPPADRKASPKCCSFCFVVIVSLVVSIVLVWFLEGVDYKGDDVNFPPYDCSSDVKVPNPIRTDVKGMAIDDTTFDCPGKIPEHWPHTDGAPVKALRLFRTTQPGWDEKTISQFRETLALYTRRTGAKVLVGTQITCSELADDNDWLHTLKLLRALNASHVLGLAVGNELDQLASKESTPKECVKNMWSGSYLLNKLLARVKDMRQIPGFDTVPVTTVFTAGVVWNTMGLPFVDTPEAGVNTFFTQVMQKEPHWAFTFNFYPYFDPTITMDPDGVHCNEAIKKCSCFDNGGCLNLFSMIQARKSMTQLTGDPNARLWVGEVGWSAPKASTLHTAMEWCADFSGYKMFYEYYKNFLAWDLSLGGADEDSGGGPEMVFYFSMRDSANFGNEEHFGLIESCANTTCKLSRARLAAGRASRSTAAAAAAVAL